VTAETPISIPQLSNIRFESALNLILEQLELTHVIDNDVLEITSMESKRSRVYPVTYPVKDLVIPIPNFTSSYDDGLAGALRAAIQMTNQQADVQVVPVSATDLGNRMSQSMSPTYMGNDVMGQYHSMGSQGGFGLGNSPASRGAGGGGAFADFDSLIELIETTVAPETWESLGGPSNMQPYAQNLSLVISTTSEVHDQIVELLESLRRLQNLQITIEVRFITLSDTFAEQIGVDFNVQFDDNITSLPDDDSGTAVTIGFDGISGLPTADFDIRFENGSFGLTPPFGAGGLGTPSTIGFAMLNDIEAFFFLQAAQADNRSNIMQAPKVTMFDGQFANIADITQTPFVTSIVPVVGDFAVAQQPVIVVLNEGTQLNVQGIVSDDKRFVRLTLVPYFSQIGDVDTFTYEGRRTTSRSSTATRDTDGDGDIDDDDIIEEETEDDVIEGTTVQLPTFASTSVQTTVSVPDGGTILLGGIKRMSEGRVERGVPILSKIPYVSRLFRNVSAGRDSSSLMLMVTPRIIIQEEEELAQTGFDPDDP
jgi:general secretion pathway protein D